MGRDEVVLVFPHQLFRNHPAIAPGRRVFLLEDPLFFSQVAFHRQKLMLHRASMKQYQEYLQGQGVDVSYFDNSDLTGKNNTGQQLAAEGVKVVYIAELVDDWLEQRLVASLEKFDIKLKVLPTPGFLSDLEWIYRVFEEKERYYFTDFYIQQRKRLGILLSEEPRDSSQSRPLGGKWSYDAENRKKLPKNAKLPSNSFISFEDDYTREARSYVLENYPESVGSAEQFYYPTNFNQAEEWLEDFLEQRFAMFGDYEDAISREHQVIFHSVLTPALNIGLLTPQQVVSRALEVAKEKNISLNSLEGFIRQVIGWREYVRAVYEISGRKQRLSNFWGHRRAIPQAFYDGTTGLPPFDEVVKRVSKTGYCHHIERLMVLGNLMLLCEIDPTDVYRWFMEMFIDSYDWVMVPNVYGMSQYADGGLITTKPYISSSNYILKMSDYPKGEWCEVWDALFWSFINKHRDFFESNPRLSLMVKQLDRIDPARRSRLMGKAQRFFDELFA